MIDNGNEIGYHYCQELFSINLNIEAVILTRLMSLLIKGASAVSEWGRKMQQTECSLEGTQEVTLKEMTPGECGYIQKVTGSGAIRRRLLEMGLIEGTLVQVIKYAPLGDPVEVCVAGTHICLRGNEAACLVMKKPETNVCAGGEGDA